MHLKEYKLFKGGRGRLSDNAKRIPLRIEADILSATVSPSSNRRRLNSWPILVATQTVSPTDIGRGCHLLREERYSSWSFISRGILRPLLESIAADVDVGFVNRLRVVTD